MKPTEEQPITLSPHEQANEVDETERLWTAVEVAAFLNVRRNRVYAMVAQHEIPHVRLGPRTIRFVPGRIRAWLYAAATPDAA